MARAKKIGIDYYSHDVDMMQDRKMKILKAKHGLIGYAVFNRLLEEIYRDKGYYLKVDEDFNLLFCDDNSLELNVYKNIINDCINKDLFNKNKYNDHNILTSKRIVENYIQATKRRTLVEFTKEYLTIDSEKVLEMYPDDVNVNINNLNDNINVLNDDKSTQRIEENRIEENIKEDNKARFDYKDIFDYYIDKENLVTHQKFTKTMKDNIKVARKELSLEKDDIKKIIDRHNKLVELTEGAEYQVKRRRLDDLFGQHTSNIKSAPLLCQEYLEGGKKYNYLKKLENNNKNKKDDPYEDIVY